MTDTTHKSLSLAEYLQLTGLTKTEFSKLIPCSYSYPGMIIKGLRPSYDMAVRIEKVTSGLVPRTNWYPAGEELEYKEVDLE